jgi:hypothetical protein
MFKLGHLNPDWPGHDECCGHHTLETGLQRLRVWLVWSTVIEELTRGRDSALEHLLREEIHKETTLAMMAAFI